MIHSRRSLFGSGEYPQGEDGGVPTSSFNSLCLYFDDVTEFASGFSVLFVHQESQC